MHSVYLIKSFVHLPGSNVSDQSSTEPSARAQIFLDTPTAGKERYAFPEGQLKNFPNE
jgi:hypothetical protein